MDNKEFNRILGRQIKNMREERKLTQFELASLMNVNAQNISSYERGQRCPSMFWMNRLYSALEVTPLKFTEEFYSKVSPYPLPELDLKKLPGDPYISISDVSIPVPDPDPN